LVVLLSLAGTTLSLGVPPCQTVFSEDCWDEPKTVCDYVKKPVTSVTYDEQCSTKYDKACDTVVETHTDLVPRVECTSYTEQECSKVTKQDCTTVFVDRVSTVAEEVLGRAGAEVHDSLR
jgi:hypothetical protein